MAFDIIEQDYSKAAELGYTFELKLPTGADSGAKLTVIGDQSATVKNYSKRKYQEYAQKQAIAKRRGKEHADDLTLEEAEDIAVESTLVRLIGWEGFTEKKKEVPFTKEKAAEILKQHAWIRDQIIEAAGDVTNFQPKASSN